MNTGARIRLPKWCKRRSLKRVLLLGMVCLVTSKCEQILLASENFAFQTPFGIAALPDGGFLVAEIDGQRISKIDAAGEQRILVDDITGYGRLRGPFDVDVAESGHLYIADTKGHSVLILDSNLQLLKILGKQEPTAKPGGFHEPHFVLPDESRNRLFVADTMNHRIQVFDLEGNLIKILGHPGRGEGSYHFVGGMALDNAGNLYAINWSGGFINIYDSELTLVGMLGGIENTIACGDAYGLTFDGKDLWIADTFHSRLLKVGLDRQIIKVIDRGEGTDLCQLNHPTDIDTDREGNLLLVDWKNNRILKLDSNGEYIAHWGGEDPRSDYQPPKQIARSPERGPVIWSVYHGLGPDVVDNCVKHGVERIYVSFDNQGGEWGIRDAVDYAHQQGVKEIVASIAIAPLGADHPTWKDRPEFFMWRKGATEPDKSTLSYFHPEVRRWKAKHIAEQVAVTSIDGVLLDYIRYPNALCGYEPVMLKAFWQATGRDANKISAEDPEWLQFRANYITKFIVELRQELAQLDRNIEISAYVGPYWEEARRLVVHNWRDWARMGIVDRLVLGLYSRDFPEFYKAIRDTHHATPDRTKVCIMIACWGGNLYTPDLLKQGADVCLAADADEISIYRGGSIEKLELWPTIGSLSQETLQDETRASD